MSVQDREQTASLAENIKSQLDTYRDSLSTERINKTQIWHNTDQSQSSESSINLHFARFHVHIWWKMKFVLFLQHSCYKFLELQTNEMLVNDRWLLQNNRKDRHLWNESCNELTSHFIPFHFSMKLTGITSPSTAIYGHSSLFFLFLYLLYFF